jgi:hypothetical protein
MTARATITQAQLRRAISAARAEGHQLAECVVEGPAVRLIFRPGDGTIAQPRPLDAPPESPSDARQPKAW